MNALLDLRILGWLLVILGGLQVVPLVAAIAFGELLEPYVESSLAPLVVGLALALGVQPERQDLSTRDGFVVVTFGWVLASLFGAIPYVATETLEPIDAVFESVAGFTTTGSSVMTRLEDAPRALLLWRSLSQWLGGMGIVVFAVALLPLLGVGGMQLLKREMPGPSVEKVRPRVAATARRMWSIYLSLTVLAWALLSLAGVGGFEALCHAFTTVSTGGFSTRSASIAAFASPTVEWIVVLFMVLAGVNFALHYRALTGSPRAVLGDAELRLYGGLLVGATALVALSLWEPGASLHATLRSAAFQVASILTTTGFATADFERWPAISQVVLLHLLLLGGMAGSTSGGVKTVRTLLGLRALRAALSRIGHPHAVAKPVMYRRQPVSDEALTGLFAFLSVYVLCVLAAGAWIAAQGYDITTAMSAALTAVGNVGPGLGEVGPADHFAHFPSSVKVALCLCMLAGRLELITVLALLRPGFWKR